MAHVAIKPMKTYLCNCLETIQQLCIDVHHSPLGDHFFLSEISFGTLMNAASRPTHHFLYLVEDRVLDIMQRPFNIGTGPWSAFCSVFRYLSAEQTGFNVQNHYVFNSFTF